MEKTGNYLKQTRNFERKHQKNRTVDITNNEINLPFGPMNESKITRPEPYVGTANDQMYDEQAGVRHNLPLHTGSCAEKVADNQFKKDDEKKPEFFIHSSQKFKENDPIMR